MSGALVDLVATGVQDAYITGQPEVSFFRQSYKRHTNFAMKPVKMVPMGAVIANGEISLKIPNKGDLLSTIWVDLTGPLESNLNSNSVNSTIFELWIGGQMVDRQDANFMVNHWTKFLADSGAKCCAFDSSSPGDNNWLPLHFFFCDGTPLPLVALQYHEVEIRVTFGAGLDNDAKPSFYAEYILLDTNERDYFVKTPHELLINQTQRLPSTNGSDPDPAFDLSLLNHPVKSLHWSNVESVSGTEWSTGNVMMWLNGTAVFDSPMPDKYFTTVQGYMHSEYASESLRPSSGGGADALKMYSFAQKANKHQPTGSCNFSRLDNAELKCTEATPVSRSGLALYAVNWNVLRIKDGLSGVAFAN